jgi:hypothetical protein
VGETGQLGPVTLPERRWTPWLLALALAAPSFAPLIGHYVGFWRMGLQPTGFIIYDSAYYLANAREHFDSGTFTALYSNAYSYDYASPRIYFQPLTFVLGVLLRLTRADPGVVFALVGIVTAAVCGRAAMALFDRFGDRDQPGGTMSFVAFFWGGGLFVLMGTLLALLAPDPRSHSFDVASWWWFVRVADPAGGWWFLNLGRNLVLPTEALYHALFFGTIAAVISRRFQLAALLIATLSISHPFTGLQLLAIVAAWSALELIVLRNRVVPTWFFVCVAILAALHVAYYLWFLPRFPEHRQLQKQWTLRWTLSFPQSLLAYGGVGALALATLGTPARLRRAVAEWPNRLLLTWVGVSLVLENHDLFVREPVQPLHFTRGYTWVALFLLGLPTLSGFFRRLRNGERRPVAWLAGAAVIVVLLSDNATWLGATTTQGLGMKLGRDLSADSLRQGFGLSRDERAVLAWMNTPQLVGRIVLSEDPKLGYLLTAYTPLRSWRSHYANTPWSRERRAELEAFFQQGKVTDAWRTLPLLVVFRATTPWHERMAGLTTDSISPAFENASYVVVQIGGTNPRVQEPTPP